MVELSNVKQGNLMRQRQSPPLDQEQTRELYSVIQLPPEEYAETRNDSRPTGSSLLHTAMKGYNQFIPAKKV